MIKEEVDRFYEYVLGEEVDFFEALLQNLSDEELDKFLEDNPDFMKE